jgi:hypothetical protein
VPWHTAFDEWIGKHIDDVDRFQLAPNSDGYAEPCSTLIAALAAAAITTAPTSQNCMVRLNRAVRPGEGMTPVASGST